MSRNDLQDITSYPTAVRHKLVLEKWDSMTKKTDAHGLATPRAAKDGAAKMIADGFEYLSDRLFELMLERKLHELDDAILKQLPRGGSAVVAVTLVVWEREPNNPLGFVYKPAPIKGFWRAQVVGVYPSTDEAVGSVGREHAPSLERIQTMNAALCAGRIPAQTVERMSRARSFKEFTDQWFTAERRYCAVALPSRALQPLAEQAFANLQQQARESEMCTVAQANRQPAPSPARTGATMRAAPPRGASVGRSVESISWAPGQARVVTRFYEARVDPEAAERSTDFERVTRDRVERLRQSGARSSTR